MANCLSVSDAWFETVAGQCPSLMAVVACKRFRELIDATARFAKNRASCGWG